MSNTLWPHGPHHTRLLCSILSTRVCSNSCPLSWWCFLTISASLTPPLLFNPSRHQGFSSQLALCIRWPKYWSFRISISPYKEYSRLISFEIDWFDLLALPGTPKSLLQHHSLKVSVLQCSAFLMLQLSHLYMTAGKTITLTMWTFVGKVMSLLFNMLSRFVIAFLPRGKCLWISWMQSLISVILEPKKMKSDTASTFFPSVYHEMMGLDAMILVFLTLSFKPAF